MPQVRQRQSHGWPRQGAGFVLSAGPVPTLWRLDVREDTNDSGLFVALAVAPSRRGDALASRHRLGHYISAGGMRAHRWSSADDLAQRRRSHAVRIMLALAALWLTFRFVPL